MKDEHVLLTGVVIILISAILFRGIPWCHFGWGPLFGPGFIFPWIGPWLIFPVIAFLIIYALLGSGDERTSYTTHLDKKGPLDILDERFVRGEIALEEYREVKKELKRK